MASRKGSPNRNKQFLLARLKEMYGDDFEPILKMAECAVEMTEIANKADPEHRFDGLRDCVGAWDKIANYVTPKLKATEITADISGEIDGKWTVEFVNASSESQ